jgi:cysteine synthase
MTEAARTPLRRVGENLLVKLELLNPGGSHKSRAARHIVDRAIREGELAPGGSRRIIEKSGGNLGVGLALAAARHDIGVDLVIGLSFSPIKRALCEAFGARLVGVEALRAGASPKEVVRDLVDRDPDGYYFTDQFANEANLAAHRSETGPELVAQLREAGLDGARPIILVKGAGTGASLTGVAERLKDVFPDVSIVAVQPAGCEMLAGRFRDHALEGIAVGVTPPFLDATLVDEIADVSNEEARAGQRRMARETGFFPGASSGACYAVAAGVAARRPDALVVTLAYDFGDYTLHREIAR